jgi:hypothetical protein
MDNVKEIINCINIASARTLNITNVNSCNIRQPYLTKPNQLHLVNNYFCINIVNFISL